MYPRESGVLYKSAVDSILALNNDRKLQGEYAAAVLEYLIYGQYTEKGNNPVVDALMQQQIYNIDAAAGRYEAAKENGTKGGNKARVTDQEVYDYVMEGHTHNEAAEHFGYTTRTIRTKVSSVRKKLGVPDVEPVMPEKVNGEWKF